MDFRLPKMKVSQNFLDHLRLLDKADDPHPAFAFGADKRVGIVYFLNQPRPVLFSQVSEGRTTLIQFSILI